MRNRTAVAMAIVSGVLAAGLWEVVRPAASSRPGGPPTGADPLAPLVTRSVPVENDDVFQAAGVYPWRWRLGLPTAPHRVTLRCATPDGERPLTHLRVPARAAGGPAEADLTLVLHFDAPSVKEAARLTCALAVGGTKVSTTLDNPFRGLGMSALQRGPGTADGRLDLMSFWAVGSDRRTELGLVIAPAADE